MNDFSPVPRVLWAARVLLALVLVGIMLTPVLANAAAFALAILTAAHPLLRRRFARVLREPMVLAALALLAVFALGTLWSSVPPRQSWLTVWGWRKLLLVPLAAAVVADDHRGKVWVLQAFVAAAALAAVVSFLAWAAKVPLPTHTEPHIFGIVARNHSTQGALFSVAAFGGGGAALLLAELAPARRRLLTVAAVLLIANVMLVTPGRAGYVVLLVCAAVLALGTGIRRGLKVRTALLVSVLLGAVTLGALVAVPASRGRIDQAVSEMATFENETELTSMGIRMVFWRNTLPMVADKPLLGVGTGGFEAAYARRVEGIRGVQGTVTRDPHNQYLAVLAENGAVGLLFLLGFIAACTRQRPSASLRVLGLGVLAAWSVTSLANSHFAAFAEGSFLYTWVGLMLAPEPAERS